MKIRLIGIRNTLGIGVHFSYFADALQKLQYWKNLIEEINFTDQQAMLAAAASSEPDDINICFVSIPLQNHFRGTNIQWIVFESTRVPPTLMSTMLTADVVWVPSVWGRDTLIQNGLDSACCDIVPEGVDTSQFHPWHPTVNDGIFRYLLTGKYEHRKSIIETIAAWAQAFGHDPTVELWIKTNHFENHEIKKQQIVQQINQFNLTNVNVWYGAVPKEELTALYHRVNVFVLPTKGEGWGLPLIEAAACGLPIITTMWSGHTEFLNPVSNSVIPVEFDMVPIACPEYTTYYPIADGNWGEWAQPRMQSLVNTLIHAREDYQQLQKHALSNSGTIRKEFSWEQSVNTAMNVLQQRGLLK